MTIQRRGIIMLNLSRRTMILRSTLSLTTGLLFGFPSATVSQARGIQSGAATKRILLLGHRGHGKTTTAAALSKRYGGSESTAHIEAAQARLSERSGVACAPVELNREDVTVVLTDCDSNNDIARGFEDGVFSSTRAILVVSSADGPMPQTREQLYSASKNGINICAVFLNKADQVDDDELLELVEMEIQEMMRTYGILETPNMFVRGSALSAIENGDRDLGDNAISALWAIINSDS